MLGVGTLLGADAEQGDVKIIPFFATQSFASDRVKSEVNLEPIQKPTLFLH